MKFEDISKEERRRAYKRVLSVALLVTKASDQAADATQESFLLAMTTRPWDSTKEPSFERHMVGILKNVLWNGRVSERKRAHHEARAAADDAALLPDSVPSAEDLAIEAADREAAMDKAAERVARLRAKLAGEPFDLELCSLIADGVSKPQEMARLTGRTVAEVGVALKRIRRTMTGIMAAEKGPNKELV